MEKQKTVLLINAHLTYPGRSEGRLNSAFQETAKSFFKSQGYSILETKIEDGYKDEEEVEKHIKADLIILQTPVHWFGAPWIYKKYVDEVFNAGYHSKQFLVSDGRTRDDKSKQYGTGGFMQGKKFMVSATWNAPKEAFNNNSQILMNGKGTDDLFLNITSNYKFCGCEIVPEFNCFDIFKGGDPAADLINYPKHLSKIIKTQEQLVSDVF